MCALCFDFYVTCAVFYSVHLLFINLVTDSLPAIAIGMEKSTRNLLQEKPRDARESILDTITMKRIATEGVLIAIVTMIAYFIGLEVSHGLAATLAFATLCLSRLFHGSTVVVKNLSLMLDYSQICTVLGLLLLDLSY